MTVVDLYQTEFGGRGKRAGIRRKEKTKRVRLRDGERWLQAVWFLLLFIGS